MIFVKTLNVLSKHIITFQQKAFTDPSSLCLVPCGPANVTTSVDCASGGVNVSWGAQRNAEGYITMISDSNQQKTVYNTTEPQLSIPSKNCGQEYTVKVMSFNRSCVSFPSQVKFKEGRSFSLFSAYTYF